MTYECAFLREIIRFMYMIYKENTRKHQQLSTPTFGYLMKLLNGCTELLVRVIDKGVEREHNLSAKQQHKKNRARWPCFL